MTTQDTRDPILRPPFDALRAGMAALDTPRGVEKELMAAFARQHPKKRWYQLPAARWGMAGGLGSAATLALVFLLSLRAPPQTGGADSRPLAGLDSGGAFIALESLERIESEPSPRVLEADLPRTTLAALGVPVTPENAGDSVRAEMLVSAEGEPLALRLVSSQQ